MALFLLVPFHVSNFLQCIFLVFNSLNCSMSMVNSLWLLCCLDGERESEDLSLVTVLFCSRCVRAWIRARFMILMNGEDSFEVCGILGTLLSGVGI